MTHTLGEREAPSAPDPPKERRPGAPRDPRHSFATPSLDAGASPRDVQDADPRTTRRYDRGRMSLDRHATDALPVVSQLRARGNVPPDTELGPPPSLEEVRRRSGEILALARAHGASRVRVVGSVARGEAGPGSDLDLLVEFGRPVGLELVRLERLLGELLGCRVDVVDAKVFRPGSRVLGPDSPARRARIRRELEADALELA